MRGSSMTDIGAFNEKLVLQLIRSAPEGIGQSEVMRRSRLSRQAVSTITRRLVADGLVQQAGQRIAGPGKPFTVLRVVTDARLAVGVHLDPAHIAVVICDLAAHPVARTTLAAPTEDPSADIQRIAEAISALSMSLGASSPVGHDAPGADPRSGRRRLLGIGIAAPAGLDAEAGIVRDPPWIPGWRDVPVVGALSELTGLNATLDKDTNAALTGEVWTRSLTSPQTVLYLYSGHGVGSAVGVGGRVHRGGTTQAGEIGHLPIGRGGMDCGCGHQGCLCLYTDAHVLIDAAQAAGVSLPAQAGRVEQIEALGRAAAGGSAAAAEVIADYGAALGRAMRILAGIHDPQRIIIGGPTWLALCDSAEAAVRAPLEEWLSQTGTVLESARLSDDGGAIGAASLFLERELAPWSGATAMA